MRSGLTMGKLTRAITQTLFSLQHPGNANKGRYLAAVGLHSGCKKAHVVQNLTPVSHESENPQAKIPCRLKTKKATYTLVRSSIKSREEEKLKGQ